MLFIVQHRFRMYVLLSDVKHRVRRGGETYSVGKEIEISASVLSQNGMIGKRKGAPKDRPRELFIASCLFA